MRLEIAAAWRLPLLQGLLLLALLLWSQWQAAAGMAQLWWRSDTFAHALLVPPIALWLVWRQRAALAALQPRACWPGLLALLAALAISSAGRLAEVNALQHFGVVFSLQALVLCLFGWQVVRQIGFALIFLLFAPPFGDFLVQTMMLQTADFTIGALRLIGIPVYREGLSFVIPSGNWSVVEACSGLRYLFASFMVGTLFAYLNFQRWPARLGFALVSLLVPVVANWLRALLIVLLGHYSSNRIATGADHLIYGWVFFGFIMMIMFWIGGRWADRQARTDQDGVGRVAVALPAATSAWPMLLASALLLVLPGQWVERLQAGDARTPDAGVLTPPLTAGAWREAVAQDPNWAPFFVGASLQRQMSLSAGDEPAVLVDIAVFPAQRDGAKAITSVNTLVRSSDGRWANMGERRVESVDGPVAQSSWSLRAAASERQLHLARRLFWVDGRFTGSEREAKWLGLRQRVAGRGDLQVVLVLMTPEAGQGAARLERLWRDLRTPLNERLARIAPGAAGTMRAADDGKALENKQ